MPTRKVNLIDHSGLRLLEQKEREARARLQSSRAAVKKGFDELDRREGVVFANPDHFDAYLDSRRLAKAKSTR